ncbi:MAG: putative photosynthetic complex assembly protein PuhE [Burkholderiaceae bacterium]|jgi:putative photosynthetic complex assembly protein 2|nr:putative photosynthetic complex assembly protein PuhE [Burkholderiaceae bacterium]
MTELALPAVFAAFVWWFSTGLVLLLDGLPRTTFRWSLALATLLAMAGIAMIGLSARDASVASAYVGFVGALLVWGWQELSFLTGWLTGPRITPASARPGSWQHFRQAIAAILWHELAIIAGGLLIAAICWHASNHVALWTYLVLWVMRSSAKLNLFFGVRNLSEEMLPPHLAYLQSFFRRRRMNLLFPLSVVGGTAVATVLVVRALDPAASDFSTTGLTLVAALLALAVLEHWLMVLPINVNAIWQWAMRSRRSPPPPASTDDDWRAGRAVAAPALAPTLTSPAPGGGDH